MKAFIDEYLEVFLYTICGMLLILGSYNILINVNHASYLKGKVIVRDIDSDYLEYKNNVLAIENNLTLKNQNSNMYKSISNALNIMKREGAYRLLPGDVLGYSDLYTLNNYFIDEIINESWISSLKQIKDFDNNYNNNYMNVLIKNANYVNKELLNNSNFHYDVRNNDVRDTIQEEYQFIMSNYKNYSAFILGLSEKLGD